MDGQPVSPTGLGGSKLRDVGRAVTAEAATHLDRLKKSERTKEAVDKSVAFAAEALEDPDKIKEAARKVWAEDQKVQAIKDRTKMFLENTMESEERMEKVSTPEMLWRSARGRESLTSHVDACTRGSPIDQAAHRTELRELTECSLTCLQSPAGSQRVQPGVQRGGEAREQGHREGGGNLPRSRNQAPGPAQHRAGQPHARGER